MFLANFEAAVSNGAPHIQWIVNQPENTVTFRLVGTAGTNQWNVQTVEDTAGAFNARDRSEFLADVDEVTYSLYYRENTEWVWLVAW